MLNKVAKIVLINIYLVIIAGSVVRMTGSGMGCPDWPKCFGHYIPPTHEDQIKWKPNHHFKKGQMIIQVNSDIQEINEMESAVAYNILLVAKEDFKSTNKFNPSNWEKYEKHDYAKFNVYHTWTEYLNRLLGAILGFVALLMLILALKKWREDKVLAILAILQLIFIGFEAWLGKITVDYNLAPITITYHMLGVLVLIIIQLWFIKRLKRDRIKPLSIGITLYLIGLIAFVLLITQIVIGTQVRQEVDLWLSKGIGRMSIVKEFSIIPYIHRSFSILLVVAISVFSWLLYKKQMKKKQLILLNSFMWGGILVGIFLFYFGLQAIGQPFHLLFSLLVFGILTWIMLSLKRIPTNVHK